MLLEYVLLGLLYAIPTQLTPALGISVNCARTRVHRSTACLVYQGALQGQPKS
jgi:hypothetical protein